MPRIGETYRCGSNDRCLHGGEGVYPDAIDEQYDGHRIYAGMWHEDCWERFGESYRTYTAEDAAANGERIEEDGDDLGDFGPDGPRGDFLADYWSSFYATPSEADDEDLY